ncbi:MULTISPECIES: SNF2-related protein [unclassified Vibrio]|uniref:SNF2-related protein n=6 Tax=Vibrio TaxID=662 RepID=UPI00354F2DC9
MFNIGDQVRLIHDPAKIGVITQVLQSRGGVNRYKFFFAGAAQTKSESDLEVVASNTWNDLLHSGRFGRIDDLRRNLTYIHISGKLANLVYSMETTNTDFFAFQYKPVLSFLEAPSKGILIADEVGLGKTIEAGLIWTELRARIDARRLMILCPAMLREKWKHELMFRFGIDADLMSAEDLLHDLKRDKKQVPTGKAVICSYTGLRPPKGFTPGLDSAETPRQKLTELFSDSASNEPLFDLIIMDEAHYMRNPESSTSKLGHLLRDATEHVVLLSATPINLANEDLFHLLELVDPDTFDNRHYFPQVLEANKPLLEAQNAVRNPHISWFEARSILKNAQLNPILNRSSQLLSIIEFEPEDGFSHEERVEVANRIERVNLLSKVVTRTRKAEVHEYRVVREPLALAVQMTDAEKEFYQAVTETVRRYASQKNVHEAFLSAMPQRQVSSCMVAAYSAWNRRVRKAESSMFDTSIEESIGIDIESKNQLSPLMSEIGARLLPEIDIDNLRENDSKFNALIDFLKSWYSTHPEDQVVLFSYFRETLHYLNSRLFEEGINAQVLMGGMKETKQEIIDGFKANKECRILLSSEVASEGVDLQFCRVLINYDLPWNPMRIEQRIGRIDRYGQKSEKIHIINFCYADTIDQRIYDRLFERLGIFKAALGDMDAILGEKIENLTSSLIREELTAQQEQDRIEQTRLAIEKVKSENARLEEQASSLIAHSGYILSQVKAAHQFRQNINEQDLFYFVKSFLDKYGSGHLFQQVLSEGLTFDVRLPSDLAAKFAEFVRKHSLSNLSQLQTGVVRRCLFSNKVTRNSNAQTEVLSQFHPLVRFFAQELATNSGDQHPLVGARIESGEVEIPEGDYILVVKKGEFSGIRVEEKLFSRGLKLGDEVELLSEQDSYNLLNATRVLGGDWQDVHLEYDADVLEEAFEVVSDYVEQDYQDEVDRRYNENADRIQFQISSAKKNKERQLEGRFSALTKLSMRDDKKSASLVAATKAQIRNIESRFDVQIEQLSAKQELLHDNIEVCFIAIRIGE